MVDREYLAELADLAAGEQLIDKHDALMIVQPNGKAEALYNNVRDFIAYASPARVLELLGTQPQAGAAAPGDAQTVCILRGAEGLPLCVGTCAKQGQCIERAAASGATGLPGASIPTWAERIAHLPDHTAAEHVDAAKDAEIADLRAQLARPRQAAQGDAVRDAALEEAAKVCDRFADSDLIGSLKKDRAREVAAAIRALRTTQPEGK